MNEIIEHCMYESGLTADGCWNELDDYAKESIERFAVLIVKKCAELCYQDDGQTLKVFIEEYQEY